MASGVLQVGDRASCRCAVAKCGLHTRSWLTEMAEPMYVYVSYVLLHGGAGCLVRAYSTFVDLTVMCEACSRRDDNHTPDTHVWLAYTH
jgi:hypothetical protein